jgi:hypothetical protein
MPWLKTIRRPKRVAPDLAGITDLLGKNPVNDRKITHKTAKKVKRGDKLC